MAIKSSIIFFLIDVFVKIYGVEQMTTIMCLLPPWMYTNLLRKYGSNVGENVTFTQGVKFVNLSAGGFSNLKLGENCYIGYDCLFDLTGEVTIEDNVTFSPRCTILSHQDVGERPLSKIYPRQVGHTIFREGCWIGANATVLGGIEVGVNSVVAAGSLLTKNVTSNTAVGGVPAHIIKENLM